MINMFFLFSVTLLHLLWMHISQSRVFRNPKKKSLTKQWNPRG